MLQLLHLLIPLLSYWRYLWMRWLRRWNKNIKKLLWVHCFCLTFVFVFREKKCRCVGVEEDPGWVWAKNILKRTPLKGTHFWRMIRTDRQTEQQTYNAVAKKLGAFNCFCSFIQIWNVQKYISYHEKSFSKQICTS